MEGSGTTARIPTQEQARSALLCPYCGAGTPPGTRCANCRGLLDPLSRQASQNAMGPWFVRDAGAPFMPGCSYETLVGMVKRGRITRRSVLRGPTTRQFWCTAERTPGISHLFGLCHNCRVDVQPTDSFCDECGAGFTVETDRQHLGLGAVHLLPGQAAPEAIADAGFAGPAAPSESPEQVAHARAQPPKSVQAAPDLTPLVNALRRKLRRQRIVLFFVLLAAVSGAAAAVWFLAPSGAIERWLNEKGISFSPSAAAPSPDSGRLDPSTKPPAPGGPEFGATKRRPADEPDNPDASVNGAPASEPTDAPPPRSERGTSPLSMNVPLPSVHEKTFMISEALPSLISETDSAALRTAAAGVDSAELKAALERRAVQLELRGFP